MVWACPRAKTGPGGRAGPMAPGLPGGWPAEAGRARPGRGKAHEGPVATCLPGLWRSPVHRGPRVEGRAARVGRGRGRWPSGAGQPAQGGGHRPSWHQVPRAGARPARPGGEQSERAGAPGDWPGGRGLLARPQQRRGPPWPGFYRRVQDLAGSWPCPVWGRPGDGPGRPGRADWCRSGPVRGPRWRRGGEPLPWGGERAGPGQDAAHEAWPQPAATGVGARAAGARGPSRVCAGLGWEASAKARQAPGPRVGGWAWAGDQ